MIVVFAFEVGVAFAFGVAVGSGRGPVRLAVLAAHYSWKLELELEPCCWGPGVLAPLTVGGTGSEAIPPINCRTGGVNRASHSSGSGASQLRKWLSLDSHLDRLGRVAHPFPRPPCFLFLCPRFETGVPRPCVFCKGGYRCRPHHGLCPAVSTAPTAPATCTLSPAPAIADCLVWAPRGLKFS